MNMNRIYGLTCLLFGSFCVYGQLAMTFEHDTLPDSKAKVELSGMLDISSNAMQRGMMQTLYLGGHLSAEEIDQNFGRLNGVKNRIGGEVYTGITYRSPDVRLFDSIYALELKASRNQLFSMKYAQDVFALLFYGNDHFEGQTAFLGQSGMRNVSFYKLGIGAYDPKSKSSITLNAYSINSLQDIFLRRGEITTASHGDSVAFNMDGRFMGTARGSGFSRGLGIGIDLNYKMPVAWFKGSTTYFEFDLRDFGVMYLPQIEHYILDTNLSVSGYTINQLQSMSDLESSAVFDSLGVRRTTQSTSGLLPAFFQLSKLVDAHSERKFQSFFGLRTYSTLSFLPQVFFGQQWRINESLRWALQGSYGGFTTWRVGSYFSAKWRNSQVLVGTEDIFGLISPAGFGTSVLLKWRTSW